MFPNFYTYLFYLIIFGSSAAIAQKYRVNKYPTLKLFVFGEPMKKEYRGQRSAEAFDKYIRDQLASPITKKETFEEMDAVSVSGYYSSIRKIMQLFVCI